jgi:hypothetical protein
VTMHHDPHDDEAPSVIIEFLERTMALFGSGKEPLGFDVLEESGDFVELAVRSRFGRLLRVVFIKGNALPDRFGITISALHRGDAGQLHTPSRLLPDSVRLRTLNDLFTMTDRDLEPIVTTRDGRRVWALRHFENESVMFICTRIFGDLTSFRQGLPANAHSELRSQSLFGFPNERPVYLYNGVADELQPFDRQADWWSYLLVSSLENALRGSTEAENLRDPVHYLVVTGDDDQADLDKYGAQQKALPGIPITYFLHPLTHHTKRSMRRLARGNPEIEFGLHPDALDLPLEYDRLLAEQVSWFERLTGTRPRSLRNHGFLNDGYWKHARSWLKHGIRSSSNIPGLDGRILNNSLLPFPLVLDGAVTDHWSIITAFGDGMIFALDMSDEEASCNVREFAIRMMSDPMDSALVVNLHPQNIDATRELHHAVRELTEVGFVPITLSSLIDQFDANNRLAVRNRWLSRRGTPTRS